MYPLIYATPQHPHAHQLPNVFVNTFLDNAANTLFPRVPVPAPALGAVPPIPQQFQAAAAAAFATFAATAAPSSAASTSYAAPDRALVDVTTASFTAPPVVPRKRPPSEEEEERSSKRRPDAIETRVSSNKTENESTTTSNHSNSANNNNNSIMSTNNNSVARIVSRSSAPRPSDLVALYGSNPNRGDATTNNNLDQNTNTTNNNNNSNLKAVPKSLVNTALPSSSPLSSLPTVLVSSHGNNNSNNSSNSSNNGRPPVCDLEGMTEEEKRRHERNLREQQRSSRISQQIRELRTLLTESKIPFKPNKYSILMSVVDYVKQLQNRAVCLDAEHRKLVDTISRTSEMVARGNGAEETAIAVADRRRREDDPFAVVRRRDDDDRGTTDSELLFVHFIDYKSAFAQCSAALGVAALDGTFLDCNAEFEHVSGIPREQLRRGSLFSLLATKDMEEVFRMMGAMLRDARDDHDHHRRRPRRHRSSASASRSPPYWSGVVARKNSNLDLMMNITLTRKPDGVPKFFNCALSAAT